MYLYIYIYRIENVSAELDQQKCDRQSKRVTDRRFSTEIVRGFPMNGRRAGGGSTREWETEKTPQTKHFNYSLFMMYRW
jgi:hypothetical protein